MIACFCAAASCVIVMPLRLRSTMKTAIGHSCAVNTMRRIAAGPMSSLLPAVSIADSSRPVDRAQDLSDFPY
jgi:hypothetical protein